MNLWRVTLTTETLGFISGNALKTALLGKLLMTKPFLISQRKDNHDKR